LRLRIMVNRSSGIIDVLERMQHRIMPTAAFLYLALSHAVWISRDTRPPFWDVAAHASSSLNVHNAFARAVPLALIAIPLQHLTGSVAREPNALTMAILMLATNGFGRLLFEHRTVTISVVLVSFYRVMLSLSGGQVIRLYRVR
jgi:hypothetical protein